MALADQEIQGQLQEMVAREEIELVDKNNNKLVKKQVSLVLEKQKSSERPESPNVRELAKADLEMHEA